MVGGGKVGKFQIGYDPAGNTNYGIAVYRGLTPEQKQTVFAHEFGHAIDYLSSYAQGIPQEGLQTELRTVYNDLNNPDLALARQRDPDVDPASRSVLRNYGPEKQGYPVNEVPRELMAEAVRAYVADPNYMKTVAPKTAAAIRSAVNVNPRLSKILQFNVIPAAAGIGAGAAALQADRHGQ